MTNLGACVKTLMCAAAAWATLQAAQAAEPSKLAASRSWAYQLQGDVSRIARTDADVAVIDWDHVRSRASLEHLKRKPDQTRRTVLGYLSIGEAENNRAYWRSCCTGGRRPGWLTDRTQGWAGNYAVHYWDADWQRIVKSRLTELIQADFDGVYLDRADVWETMRSRHPSARADMIGFIRSLSALARSAKPGFVVIVQNAEELLTDGGYLSAIDGIAKEDLIHGVNHDGRRNPSGMIQHSVRLLQQARARGKAIFVVEYLPEGQLASGVRAEITRHGFIPLFATRNLAGR